MEVGETHKNWWQVCGQINKLTGILKCSSSFMTDEAVPSSDSKLFLGASAPELYNKTIN